MSRVDTEQATLLERIADYLRKQLRLNARRCFETLDPLHPVIPPGGDYFLSVAPGDGTFDVEHQVGGGADQLTEYGEVVVTIYSRVKLDSTDHDEIIMRDASRGLLSLKKTVLKTLVGYDLALESGDTALRQTLYAKRYTAPTMGQQDGSGIGVAFLSITFGVDFDWDLS